MRNIRLVLTSVFFMLLTACASGPTQPVSIFVTKDEIQVLGTSVKTNEEWLKLLTEKKIRRVHLHFAPGLDYERIGRVIYSMPRNSIEVELTDRAELK